MSSNVPLCSFCRFIPFDVNRLERLRLGGQPASSARKRDRSSSVRLDINVKTRIEPGARATFALGKAGRVLNSDCPFCKIVSIAVKETQNAISWTELNDDTTLTLTWNDQGPGFQSVFKVNDHDEVYICFVRETPPSPNEHGPSGACYIHPIQSRINPSRISSWIMECETFHGPDCNAHTNDTGRAVRELYRGLELLRFVDVHQHCIVESRTLVRYVALSYVWGAAATLRLSTMNEAQLRRPGSLLRTQLPRTILDAMDLVKSCGERYIWIDSLCIVQNDLEDLEAGIHVMDLVFEMSVFTVVAACGSDARSGLPGLRSGSRLVPAYMEVLPGVRVGVVSELDHLLERSCYSTRGWT